MQQLREKEEAQKVKEEARKAQALQLKQQELSLRAEQLWPENFGNLRAAVQQPVSVSQAPQFLDLVRWAYETDKERYNEQWRTFLRDTAQVWNATPLCISSNSYGGEVYDAKIMRGLQLCLDALPFAQVALEVRNLSFEFAKQVAHSHVMSQVTSLSFVGVYAATYNQLVAVLMESPHLSQVNRLEFSLSHLTLQAGLKSLRASGVFDDLKTLRVSLSDQYQMDRRRLLKMAESGWLTSLHELGLTFGFAPLEPAMMIGLGAPGLFPHLTSLSLKAKLTEPDTVRALTDAEWWPNLKVLNLPGTSLNSDTVQILMDRFKDNSLSRLDLSQNKLDAEVLHALTTSPHLSGLKQLNVEPA